MENFGDGFRGREGPQNSTRAREPHSCSRWSLFFSSPSPLLPHRDIFTTIPFQKTSNVNATRRSLAQVSVLNG